MKTVYKLLTQYGIDYLYHITSVDNLSSILFRGILSHHQTCIQNLKYTDISDLDVQKRRSDKRVKGMSLHRYVPLYFNPKNPMLFARRHWQSQIAILAIDPLVLLQPRTVFSDGNASCQQTLFYQDLSSLACLNWEIIHNSTWHDQPDGKRIKCAEVLVYPRVAVRDILKIFCYSQAMIAKIETLGLNNLVIEVNQNLYF